MQWVLPYTEKDHKGGPMGYFSHLLGHEGENSLISYLKAEGLVSVLAAGESHELNGLTMMDVKITLTKAGLAQYERVIEATFQYL